MDSKNSHNEESKHNSSPSLVPSKQAPISVTHNNSKSSSSSSSSSSVFLIDALRSEYQGFWYMPTVLENIKSVQEHLQGQPGDILLCSAPKAGTTWLKSLAFAIMTRSQHGDNNNSLLNRPPHECVPYIEADMKFAHSAAAGAGAGYPKLKECIVAGNRRLLATHIPYTSLPASLITSSKIIYICREPKDVLISKWQFISQFKGPVPLETMFEAFCDGKELYEPYWDHVLGYWKASLENPDNIMFCKYEDLMCDNPRYVKKIAEFLGCPFSLEEEERGEVERIVTLCSFKNLSTLEVNKVGEVPTLMGSLVSNKAFFRKGKVGDWKHHLTAEMKERIDGITQEKFKGYDLTFPDPPY